MGRGHAAWPKRSRSSWWRKAGHWTVPVARLRIAQLERRFSIMDHCCEGWNNVGCKATIRKIAVATCAACLVLVEAPTGGTREGLRGVGGRADRHLPAGNGRGREG